MSGGTPDAGAPIDTAAEDLARHVLSMTFATPAGHHARALAMRVLGFRDPFDRPEAIVAVTTNGTTRFVDRDEPLFLIRGSDAVSGDAVRAWADLAEDRGAGEDILVVARAQARAMDEWETKKTPDLHRDPFDRGR